MVSYQKIHLICLPYSGGSGFAFQNLAAHWSPSWKVTTITYPGRGHRITEPLAQTMNELVRDTWQQIKLLLYQPYILFGHSLGSTLAYLLAHKAIEERNRLPLHLFLSGTDAPSIPSKQPHKYLFSKRDFKKELKNYGGISEDILNDEAAFDFFEPILRADFQAVETWQYTEKPKLDIPATVITGTEEDMSEADIQRWQQEFTTEVSFKKMKGNHFFLFENAEQFVRLLQNEAEMSKSQKTSSSP